MPELKRRHSAIFTLDLKSKQIKIALINNSGITEERVLWENIPTGDDIKYKLAVALKDIKDSITVSVYE